MGGCVGRGESRVDTVAGRIEDADSVSVTHARHRGFMSDSRWAPCLARSKLEDKQQSCEECNSPHD
jgi:hypothetical protein